MNERWVIVSLEDLESGLKNDSVAALIAIENGICGIDDDIVNEHKYGFGVTISITATDSDSSASWSIGPQIKKTIDDLKAIKLDKNAENSIPEEDREDFSNEEGFEEGWELEMIQEHINGLVDLYEQALENNQVVINFWT